MIYQADAAEVLDMDMCKEALELLHAHYPMHLWVARCNGGVLFIKNLRLTGPKGNGAFGFALKTSNLTDAKQRAAKIIRAGGELLERAGWARQAWQEGMIRAELEGAR
jgi:hypothetical protein